MLIRQPNGKYCYFERSGEVIKNLSEEDFILLKENEAKSRAKEEIKNSPNSPADLIRWHKVSDSDLKSMGYERTYSEMIKYIPKKVVNASYSPRDCGSYGCCPTCNAPVKNDMGGKDEFCRICNQALSW